MHPIKVSHLSFEEACCPARKYLRVLYWCSVLPHGLNLEVGHLVDDIWHIDILYIDIQNLMRMMSLWIPRPSRHMGNKILTQCPARSRLEVLDLLFAFIPQAVAVAFERPFGLSLGITVWWGEVWCTERALLLQQYPRMSLAKSFVNTWTRLESPHCHRTSQHHLFWKLEGPELRWKLHSANFKEFWFALSAN